MWTKTIFFHYDFWKVIFVFPRVMNHHSKMWKDNILPLKYLVWQDLLFFHCKTVGRYMYPHIKTVNSATNDRII